MFLQTHGWERRDFEVAIGLGALRCVDGWTRENFGIYECLHDGRSLAYLVHVPTGDALALFCDPALAHSAAEIVEGLGDCSNEYPPGSEVLASWMRAGFFVKGDHNELGDHIWYWSASAARAGAGTA